MRTRFSQKWPLLAAWRRLFGLCRNHDRQRRCRRPHVLNLRIRSKRFRLLCNHLLPSFVLLNKTLDSLI
jgi:hypothetical protein